MNYQLLISTLKFTLVLIFVGFFANIFFESYKTNIRNNAIDTCYKISQYQATYKEKEQMVTISQPQTYIYQQCLKDKGVSVNPNR